MHRSLSASAALDARAAAPPAPSSRAADRGRPCPGARSRCRLRTRDSRKVRQVCPAAEATAADSGVMLPRAPRDRIVPRHAGAGVGAAHRLAQRAAAARQSSAGTASAPAASSPSSVTVVSSLSSPNSPRPSGWKWRRSRTPAARARTTDRASAEAPARTHGLLPPAALAYNSRAGSYARAGDHESLTPPYARPVQMETHPG